jgi:hypothetical protein
MREPIDLRNQRWLRQHAELGQTPALIAKNEGVSKRLVQLCIKWARENPETTDAEVKAKAIPDEWEREFRDRPEYQTREVKAWLAGLNTHRKQSNQR